MNVVGIDIGGTKTSIGIIDLKKGIVNCKIIMQLFANLGIYIKQFFMCYL